MIPRKIHKLYANLLGYFWIDCERCGKGFGGHQWGGDERQNDRWWMHAEPGYAEPGHIEVWHGGASCAYCPSCAKTRDNWEPNWRLKKDNPEKRTWNAG